MKTSVLAGCFFAIFCAVGVAGLTQLPPPVPGFPIGRCVRVIGVTAPEDAKTVGFEYVELALQDILPLSEQEFAQTVTRIRALGIPALSGYGFLPADLKVVGPEVDKAVEKARVDEHLRHGLLRAARLGLKLVVFGNLNGQSRNAPAGFSRDTAWKQLVDFGQRAATEAKKHGLIVLIEPLPARSTNLINTVAEALELIRAVRHPHFQMLVDYSFMAQGKEDLTILHEAGRHIRQVEISNPNGRVYPKSADEVDYGSFFRALRRGGYTGGISIHGQPTDFFTDAPRAIALLRRLAAER
jgi:D-psicose/D-tagatose/L-ribulose 3-epimerase